MLYWIQYELTHLHKVRKVSTSQNTCWQSSKMLAMRYRKQKTSRQCRLISCIKNTLTKKATWFSSALRIYQLNMQMQDQYQSSNTSLLDYLRSSTYARIL